MVQKEFTEKPMFGVSKNNTQKCDYSFKVAN